MNTNRHAILFRTADGTLRLGTECKTPECAALGVSPFEGDVVLGTVALLPEPVSGMSYRLAAQPLIAELGQEVAPVAWMAENGTVVTQAQKDMFPNSLREHVIPLYTSPAHTSEARDAARYRALKTHFQAKFHRATCDYWVIVGELKTDPRFIGEDGEQLTLDNALDAAIAAMRQEAGDE